MEPLSHPSEGLDNVGRHDHKDAAEQLQYETGPKLTGLTDTVAFNAEAVPEHVAGATDERGKLEKLKQTAKTVAHATAHPHQTIKQRGQKHLSKTVVPSERPWLDDSVKADEQLLDAHDDLDRLKAEHRQERINNDLAPELEGTARRIDGLEHEREDLAVAWDMARYVRRARVVRRPIKWPLKERYHVQGPDGRVEGFNWMKWIGHLILYGFQDTSLQYIDPTNAVPYSKEELNRTIERLLVAAEPSVYWWMRVRHVYRWEDPWLTFKWLVLYLVLLKTGYFMSWYWCYLLYSVITNYDGRHSRWWMRKAHDRSQDRKARAALLSEMVMRHGPDNWLEPLLDEFGPWLQLQLRDLAQFLEISSNYYMWKNVSSTTWTCVGYFTLLLISAIPDVQFSIKVFWVAVGVYFFMSRPIASLYPRFRHVVNPLKWFFWHQPTGSEYAFGYLRKHALPPIDRTLKAEQTGESEDEVDAEIYFDSISKPPPYRAVDKRVGLLPGGEEPFMHFRAHWSGRRGRLEIMRTSLRFTTATMGDRRNVEWERSLADLLEVRKLNVPLTDLPKPSMTKLSQASAALSILWLVPGTTNVASIEEQPNSPDACDEEVLYAMGENRRNEAFNALIGISGALWQELQPQPEWQTRQH
ncbi:hypothetical protein EJ03DRAFT_378752 [Teratosphaeria nubilosa]|uniref:Uncharacterized protein n=1 Tax=Teratosphaeria nubilosa TaxID=161662 RepID=A0A6G1KVS3_9PEZI|nr:hypothetical protein EJ03DRAFT_378752 [Teratosphaeria nubilosa]